MCYSLTMRIDLTCTCFYILSLFHLHFIGINACLYIGKNQAIPFIYSLCSILICRFMQNTTTQWRRVATLSFEKYISHFIGKVCVWERVRDRTELQYMDPHSYGHQRCVFLVLQGLLNRRSGSPLCWVRVFSTASCHQRVSIFTRGSRGPLLLGGGFLFHILSSMSPVSKLTDFLSSPSYRIVQSPTQSLEWHVWSSPSGNNCHAVHRPHSSNASVYDCTAGFYLVPYCQPSQPTRFPPITAIGMCHFHRLWNGMFSRVEGQYKTFESNYFLISVLIVYDISVVVNLFNHCQLMRNKHHNSNTDFYIR